MTLIPLHRVRRLLVVMPSWMGDCVMATPALRLIRSAFHGVVITLALRPGTDKLLAGSSLMDRTEVVDWGRASALWRGASRLRAFEYSAAIILPNSFSSALLAYLSRAPMRLGYARDSRSVLLTHRVRPPLRTPGSAGRGRYAVVSAVDYYLHLARCLIESVSPGAVVPLLPRLELGLTPDQERAGDAVLGAAGFLPPPPPAPSPTPSAALHSSLQLSSPITTSVPAAAAAAAAHTSATPQPAHRDYLVLIPGANNPAKRWPADRFAALAVALAQRFGLGVMLSGSPAEAGVLDEVERAIRAADASIAVASGARLAVDQGSLKRIIGRARLVITNDTGPRHIAAALGVPTLVFFGPTDPRWTLLPGVEHTEAVLTADPTLPPEQLADEHPERCRIDRITLDAALGAAVRLLESPRAAPVLSPALRLTPPDAGPGPRPPTPL